jgi:hypothetical protein
MAGQVGVLAIAGLRSMLPGKKEIGLSGRTQFSLASPAESTGAAIGSPGRDGRRTPLNSHSRVAPVD